MRVLLPCADVIEGRGVPGGRDRGVGRHRQADVYRRGHADEFGSDELPAIAVRRAVSSQGHAAALDLEPAWGGDGSVVRLTRDGGGRAAFRWAVQAVAGRLKYRPCVVSGIVVEVPAVL